MAHNQEEPGNLPARHAEESLVLGFQRYLRTGEADERCADIRQALPDLKEAAIELLRPLSRRRAA